MEFKFLEGNIVNKKIVLAYSGGLDTSVILAWLINQGYEVICFVADVGQQENFEHVKEKALKIGASKVYIENLQQEFLEEYVFTALKANAVYEDKYLLGTSLARPLIAKKQVELAYKEGAKILAHGATGKGNDQVRFEMTYKCLMPDATIIAPWKDPLFLNQFKGRADLLSYAHAHNIPITLIAEKPYSIDANLMHISYEAGVLEDPTSCPENIFQWTKSIDKTPENPVMIALHFKGGIPVKVINETEGIIHSESLDIFNYINKLGALHGIGRVDIVENRYVGMKIRCLYEAPAATILWQAHRDLEGLVLDREVTHLKDILMPKIAELIYNGFWFSPEMNFLMSAINNSQEHLDGVVYVKLHKGNVIITGRQSPYSLYRKDIASMDETGSYNPLDAQGFINIQSLRLKLYAYANTTIATE
jgi:argininosuccinate synthase